MSDYASSIYTNLYKYRRSVYVTEPTGVRQTYIPLRLDLHAVNFNFNLARSDGSDFRLAQASNGTGVLHMWIAYWNATANVATIWFKLPDLLASETKTLYAFWGFPGDSGISNLENLYSTVSPSDSVFLFADDFDTHTLDTDKWTSTNGSWSINNSRINLSTDAWIRCGSPAAPLAGVKNWIVEDGFYNTDTPTSTAVPAHRYRFLGGNNVLGIDYYWEGATDRRHDFIYDGTYSTYDGTNKGLIAGTEKYTQSYVAYYEPTDRVYQGMHNRGGTPVPIYSENLCVDSSYAQANYTVPGGTSYTAVFDGNTGSYWACALEPGWVGYEFVVPQVIGKVRVWQYRCNGYKIQGANDNPGSHWDSKTWTDLFDAVDYPGLEWNVLEFTNTTPYKYIRMYLYDNYSTASVFEMEIMSILSYQSDLDYDDSWERKVHGDTEVTDFRIYGEDTSAANGVLVDWVVAREYTPESDPIVDTSDLYQEYDVVNPPALSAISYQSDITSVNFYHISDMGGDPYTMSDDNTSGIFNVFVSDVGTTLGSITIDFGRTRTNVVDNDYLHLDNNAVYFYNAVKLSDYDVDIHGRDYWQCTTTHGWAAIKFPAGIKISSLSLTAVPGNTGRMAKNFRFLASQEDPRYGFPGYDKRVVLYEGTAAAIETPQAFHFSTGSTLYNYFILDVLDTHGGNIAIQEWTMHEYTPELGKRVITQLRLRPVTFSSGEYYLPKRIELHASNDGLTWTTLLPETETYTPFIDFTYGRWGRYSFDNTNPYYLYKLICHDNWEAGTDQIKMAEWEMVERSDEADNIRILYGTTNNISNIWADPTTTLRSGVIYIFNDVLNTVVDEKLASYTTISGAVSDFNVKL